MIITSAHLKIPQVMIWALMALSHLSTPENLVSQLFIFPGSRKHQDCTDTSQLNPGSVLLRNEVFEMMEQH